MAEAVCPAKIAAGKIGHEAVAEAAGKVDAPELAHTVAAQVVVLPYGKAVGDGGISLHSFSHPVLPGGFEDILLLPVGNNKAVVVVKLAVVVAATGILPVCFQQGSDAVEGMSGGIGPFQGQAQHIHAGEAAIVLAEREAGENGFVADDHALFVGAHFCAPHLEGLAEDHLIGLRGLRDRDEGSLYGLFRMLHMRVAHDGLGFVGFAVGIFAEDLIPTGLPGEICYESVAHGYNLAKG